MTAKIKSLEAVIFDLDGVITDTAEYHYQAWQRLADEEGLSFDRKINEQLRGVSRRQSLLIILDDRSVAEEKLQEMMDRKNGYYQELLKQVSPDGLLPGVLELLNELEEAGIPCAVASASRNAPQVAKNLGIADRLSTLADGSSVERQKPAPDLFRYAAAQLNVSPDQCLVVEDAAAGIEAAMAAAMAALALGPAERFETTALMHQRFSRRDNLQGLDLAAMQAMVQADPTWIVTQEKFDPPKQHHMETVFTIGNGYFATRGSLEEGYPDDMAATFAHGIFDDVPIARTELANLPNWLDLEITVDGDRFGLEQGKVLHFARQLDLGQAILRRQVRWQAPNGTVIDLYFERFASYSQPHLAALRVLVTAIRPCRITVATGLNGHVANRDLLFKQHALHWQHLDQGPDNSGALWLHSRTLHSNLDLGVATNLQSSTDTPVSCRLCPGQPRFQVSQCLSPGQTMQVDKLVSYTTSRDAAAETADDVTNRALAALTDQVYDDLKVTHIAAWHRLWQRSDVVIEGDVEAQLAIRFNLFQLLAAAPQHDERISIGAKALSGYGYRGHVFWDTEIFILPFFIFTQPHLARNMLMYRYHTLPGARRKAATNEFDGAQFAWESALSGDEVTPTWVPDFEGTGLTRIWAGDIEIHISADIAYAIHQYWRVSGDDAYMRDYGAEIILDTARFWGERAEREEEDGHVRYALRDVVGPDEYHEHVDNNVYTNRLAQWHLQTAFHVLDWLRSNHPAKAYELKQRLELTEARLSRWQDVINHIIVHHDPETGLMLQFDDFFERKPVDWSMYKDRSTAMQALLGMQETNESQVIKQADVIMLLCLLRDEYDAQSWQANWEAYMPITDHRYGSSLGPSIHAWAACEMDRADEAYDHFMLAARADLADIRDNAYEGIHAASAGGLWQAIIFGFAGLAFEDDRYDLSPRLPTHWTRLAFGFEWRGQSIRVDIRTGHPPKVR